MSKSPQDQATGSEQSDNFSLVEAELKIADFWQRENIFQQSLEESKSLKPYVFYDGPPFATGLPHHGHFTASTIKDVVPRYWTMQGHYVDRRFGWDCHGLPIEYEIDKKLNMSTQKAIEKFGVAGYNQHCRSIVQLYTSEWRKSITRLGRWVDFDHDYKTMDPWFMESVWWVFRQLWDKGLIYKGFKVMPVSTALNTALSNFEANSNYQQTQDPSVTVMFKLADEDAYLLAWTTTPWTLPANLAICAAPELDYLKVRDTERDLVCYLAKARLDSYRKSHPLEVIAELKGKDLLGRSYRPLFPYFSEYADTGHFVVLNDHYVTAESGTGLVHMAPAFGVEDHRVVTEAGLEGLVCPVDMSGVFAPEVVDFAGQQVRQADLGIIRYLKERQTLYQQDVIEHSYPFCYRSDTPLIYRAIDSWYVAVTQIKDRLIQANEQVRWVPEHIKHGRFGNWLEDVRDWSISRNRVWGTPLPIWVNEENGKTQCFGSIEALEKVSGTQLTDLHREHVDQIEFSLPGEAGVYRRIPEVFDCWFESGSMPYAQVHYPFENREQFEATFPAEFISEGLDQTRGWFYTLMVLSTALFDKPAFKNVIVNGMVMAEDGKKMSKRLRNYTAPDELMSQYGADPLRLYLISGNLLKGEEQRFSDQGVKEMARRVLLPWYNAWKFLKTYATLDQWSPDQPSSPHYQILDRWIISRLQTLKASVNREMAAYRLYSVAPLLFDFIEELTNWYIRLNRPRFWGEAMDDSKLTAYQTLYQTIDEFSLVMAPFAPFLSETIYQQLLDLNPGTRAGKPKSIHLKRYPETDGTLVNPPLEDAVQIMQQIVLMGRQERERVGVNLRMPLRQLTIIHKDQALLAEVSALEQVLQAELNVKNLSYNSDEARFVGYATKPNFPLLGKRLGKRMKGFQQAIQGLSLPEIEAFQEQGTIEVEGEVFNQQEIEVLKQPKENSGCVTNKSISIILDCQLDPELIEEGHARELVRAIQQTRKNLNLQVTDRIKLLYQGDAELVQAVENHRDYICRETLTVEAAPHSFEEGEQAFDHQINDYSIRFNILPQSEKAD